MSAAAAAARMGDEVAHGFGMLAMVAGAVAGAVIGVAIVGATAVTGGMALAVVAGSIAGAGLSLGQLVKGVNRVFNLPEPSSGALMTGSPNIRINGRPAIRAHLDIAACSGFPINHYPMPAVPVAEGSASVRFNGMPAARIGSKMVCGAHIKNGSSNVTIGGETMQTDTVWDSEEWTEYGLMALGFVALGAAGGAIGWAKTLAGFVGGAVAFEGIGRLGDAIGPGYRDIFQGLAGVALLGLGLKSVFKSKQTGGQETLVPPKVENIKTQQVFSNKEITTIKTKNLEEQINHAAKIIPGLEVEQARTLLSAAFNPNKPVEVVIGGSRVRSIFENPNFRLDSDLDIGFAAKMKNSQIDKILDQFDAIGPLKSERGIKIFSGNNPPSGPIASPQEFFQRSGVREFPIERMGEPFGPSGYISFHPDGTITIVPPGIN